MLCFFYCTAKSISYKYAHVWSFLGSFPVSVITEYWIAFPVLSTRFSLAIYYIHGIDSIYVYIYIFQSQLDCQSPNSSLPPFFSWCPYICSLHLCLFCFANKIIYSASLDSIYHMHICIKIWYLFLSFWLTSLCMTLSRSIHVSTNDPISLLFMTE